MYFIFARCLHAQHNNVELALYLEPKAYSFMYHIHVKNKIDCILFPMLGSIEHSKKFLKIYADYSKSLKR